MFVSAYLFAECRLYLNWNNNHWNCNMYLHDLYYHRQNLSFACYEMDKPKGCISLHSKKD